MVLAAATIDPSTPPVRFDDIEPRGLHQPLLRGPELSSSAGEILRCAQDEEKVTSEYSLALPCFPIMACCPPEGSVRSTVASVP